MADFVKIHKKNVRFSVNRTERLFFKLSEDERNLWLHLVSILQDRRNTGTGLDTFMYCMKKPIVPKKNMAIERNARFSVMRNKGVLIKLSVDEKEIWDARLKAFGGTNVECFMDMVNTEYTFQDSVKLITK